MSSASHDATFRNPFFNPASDTLRAMAGCLMDRAWTEQRIRRLNPAFFSSGSKLTIRESFD
jgi:hypothetical protein